MSAPFFDVAPVVTAIPVGLAFGVALERAGFGVPRTIAAQLAGRDFTVMKVMFSAIVTAMLGLFWSQRLGWLDASRLALPPTDLLPQLIGAAVFGAGFAIASLCPGTACVAAGTGRRDGLVTIVGLFVGTLVTAELWPQLGRAAENVFRPDATLPADLGLGVGTTVAVLVMVAVLAIWCGGLIERRVGTERLVAAPRVVAVLSGGALLLALLAAASDRVSAAPPKSAATVAAIDLAGWIHDQRPGLRLIEVSARSGGERYEIPGSTALGIVDLDTLALARGDVIVLYADSAGVAEFGALRLRQRGAREVLVLRDGVTGWERDIISPVIPPAGDSVATAEFERVRSLSRWFGGRPVTARRLEAAPRPRRRNTC